MGDQPPPPGALTDLQGEEGSAAAPAPANTETGYSNAAGGYPPSSPAPTHSSPPQTEQQQKQQHQHQQQSHPSQQQQPSQHHPQLQPHPAPQHHAFASQLDMAQQQGGSFDMSSMANALPQHQPGFRPAPYGHSQQRFTAPSPRVASQIPGPPYGAPPAPGAMGSVPGPHPYYHAQHGQMPQFYATPVSPQQSPPNIPPRHDLGFYPTPGPVNQQADSVAHYYYAPAAAPFPGQAHHIPSQLILGQYATAPNIAQHPHQQPQHQVQTQSQHQNDAQGPAGYGIQMGPVEIRRAPSDNRHSIVRGPPRKPKQSGHAIWIGNLPPQTDLMSLVEHVCKLTEGLESVFLISKSNCAFANFKDEQLCVAAQRKLHDSRFSTVRLVSRLRKNTVEGPAGVTAPTAPAEPLHLDHKRQERERSQEPEGGQDNTETTKPAPDAQESTPASPPPAGVSGQKDRFFILKSLTVEDLELSVQTNIWATQSHNEETLNSAFKSADNVFLIFSANKSGEYFGYARMTSPINDDPAAAIEFAPKAQASTGVDLPKAIPTEATEFAPRGHIIDDSARGTIFWEVDHGDDGTDGGADEDGSGGSVGGGDTGSVRSVQDGTGVESKTWGKPFHLEWLSTTRLPFYRTRGLRNLWNSNREVKIARDGTELEPSVGRKLIGLFHRIQSPVPMAVPAPAYIPGFVVPQGPAMGARMPVPVAVPAGLPGVRLA